MADTMQDDDNFQGSLDAFEKYMKELGNNITAENQAKARQNFHDILSQILIFFRYTCIDGKDKNEDRLNVLKSIQDRVSKISLKYGKLLLIGEYMASPLDKSLANIIRFIPADYHFAANQINTTIKHSKRLMITQCKVTNEGGGTIEIKLDLILEHYKVWFQDQLELIKQDYNFISQHQDAFKELDVFMMQEILLKQRGLEQVHRYIAYNLNSHIDRMYSGIRNILPEGSYYFKFNMQTSLISPPQNFVLFRPEVTLNTLRAFQIEIHPKKLPYDTFYSMLKDHFLMTADDLSFFRKKIDRYMKIE